jgi:hypothetical protein
MPLVGVPSKRRERAAPVRVRLDVVLSAEALRQVALQQDAEIRVVADDREHRLRSDTPILEPARLRAIQGARARPAA